MLVSQGLIALASSKLNFQNTACSLASSSSFLLEGWDEPLDVKISDHLLEHCVVSDINLVNLNLRFLWDEVQLLFSLLLYFKNGLRSSQWISIIYLFLESEWNSSDGSLLNSLHQVSGVTSDLVSKSLGLNDTDIIDDSFVDMEVIGQPSQKHDQLNNGSKPWTYSKDAHVLWVRFHK